MRRAEIQAPGEHTAPGTSSATPPGEELTWAPKEGPDLQPRALPRKLHHDGRGPLAPWTQLAFYSHITGDTFLQTYHFPLPFYNYQRVKRTLNFTAYIAVQLHENGCLLMLSLVFCLFEIRCFKKKNTTGN